jgi:hypothetical protein
MIQIKIQMLAAGIVTAKLWKSSVGAKVGAIRQAGFKAGPYAYQPSVNTFGFLAVAGQFFFSDSP